MKKYNIIMYRLKKSVKPAEVLPVIEELMQKHTASYEACLLKLGVVITEFEQEGKLYSNRAKNAIRTVCRAYPEVQPFLKEVNVRGGGGHVIEELRIQNFSEEAPSQADKLDYASAREIVSKIPRPYSVNDLDLIFDGVRFAEGSADVEHMRPPKDGFGNSVGHYIHYSWSVYGNEKHSFLFFAADDESLPFMRKLFFEAAERLPGRYEGVQYHE